MKLAYQTITWGGVFGHPAGVTSVKDLYYLANGSNEQATTDIAAAGYQGFELFDGNLMQYVGREKELQVLMQRLNVKLVAVYSGANFIYPDILRDELAKIEGAAKFAKQMGAEHLVVGGGGVRASGIQKEDYRRLGDGLNAVIEIAQRVGLTASYHPHLGTIVEGPDQIAQVLEQTRINFCPDTAHQFAAGGDPAQLIRTYADRIQYIHLKDFRDGTFLPLGQGVLDFPDILRALRDIHYDGWITVELDSYAGHPRAAAQISKAFLEAT